MSDHACPACGRPALAPWRAATASDPQLAGSGPFSLARCEACGSAATVGDAPDRAAMYEGGTYATAQGPLASLVSPLRRIAERDRLRFAAHLKAGSRVLEVGAGDGRLVAAMRAAGLDAHGIDPSPAACEAARRLGVEVLHAGVDEAQLEPASEDAVVIWHTLEHLDSPAMALARARGWTRPGGALVVAVPNLASLQARIGGDRWFHQDVPRHRVHFTPAGATALLERSGYRVERVRHLLVEQNPLGMWQTLLNRLTRERDFAFRALKRDLADGGRVRAADVAVTAVAGPLLAPVALLAELGAGLGRRGGSIVVQARVAG
jgi:SAM-dependent methyltransferase